MSAGADIAIAPMPAGFDRWHELLDVIRQSFAYMYGIVDPPSSAHRLTAETLAEKAGTEISILATAGDAIVGCVFLAGRADHLYLGKLAVLPRWQGRGIGRLLLDAAEEHARAAGMPAIELQTRVELANNHRAFAALGFIETGRTAHAGYARPTSITMRKPLA